MKPFARTASVRWLRARRRGQGAIRAPNAALKMALYAAKGGLKRRGTDPPELLAAAHAGSFAVTLANELAEAGYLPHQIETTATVTMEHHSSGWMVAHIDLDVAAQVPNVAECDFVDAALRAKAHCAISRALNVNISMRARLSDREPAARLKARRRVHVAPATRPGTRAREMASAEKQFQ